MYMFKGATSLFSYLSPPHRAQLLTLLHSEGPKLYGALVLPIAIVLKIKSSLLGQILSFVSSHHFKKAMLPCEAYRK